MSSPSVFTLVVAALLAPAAGAQTQQFCPPSQAIPLSTTNWRSAVTVQRFDPALGVLQRVDYSMTADVEVGARFESLDAQPTIVTLQRTGQIVLNNPSSTGALLTATPGDMFTESVTAFDGVIDFGGTSGRTYPPLLFSQMSAGSTTNAAEMAQFTGPAGNPGTVVLPASGSGLSMATGPGNIISAFTTRAGVTVTVCYVYLPDCNQNGIPDNIDIANGAPDLYGPTTCAADGIPDSCQPLPDCDQDGIPDLCEIAAGAPDRYGPNSCSPDGIPDACQPDTDCDADGLPDRCELASNDCDTNGIPDDCQPDCDGDGIADACEILAGEPDNYCVGICTPDGIPDVCQPQPDCDADGIPDFCEILAGAPDVDGNGVPDDCETAMCPPRNPIFGLGVAGQYTVLALEGSNLVIGSAATTITGDVAMGPDTTGSLLKATINGTLRLDPSSAPDIHPDLIVTGGIVAQNLAGASDAAIVASASLAGLAPTQTHGAITTSTTFVGNGGLNVIALNSVTLVNRTLTIRGGASDVFIFNVQGRFKLSSSQMILDGVDANNVLWNFPVTGAGDVDIFKPVTVAHGTFLAPNRNIILDKAFTTGALIGGAEIRIHSGATLHCP